MLHTRTASLALLGLFASCGGSEESVDYIGRAETWIDSEFQPSTLTREQQLEEMSWFVQAAEPFRGMQINVVSETITTHEYEAQVLAKAFSEITGIDVTHNLIQEGDVIEKLQTQMQSGRSLYDAYVNDSDLIGTHVRYGQVVPISDFIAGDGAAVTLPTLDLDDFIGKSFCTGPDGKLWQLPDQQFANLYWFRQDLFSRPDLRERFRAKYGYDLDVPVNWSAYEDIAAFFTDDVKELDGERIWGHMDYGKKDPSLGWRFSDAWLSMAGVGDPGLPNGLPVDEWGIRVEGCSPVGASVTRGGAVNSPAAVYSLVKYRDWLQRFAPPEAAGMTFSESGPVPGQGHIAQQIFWYTAFTASMTGPELPVTDDEGNPLWRMAPSPHGAYWSEGMKLGYQDCGAWTFLESTPLKRRQAAWLYAQFTVCKTTSLKKFMTGLTPIRESDLQSDAVSERAPELGGLVEFYRSPARVSWTPTGTNVPDYPKLSQLWWQNVSLAVTGEESPQGALDKLAREMDAVLARLERGGMESCAPVLGEELPAETWFGRAGSPKPKLADEKPKGRTVPYEELLESWK